MTHFRRFRCDDLLRMANVNLDSWTETYNFAFYFMYMAKWPEYVTLAESPTGRQMGYIWGKAEGEGEKWHGHVTAVTVAPEYRRIALANSLMHVLEQVTEVIHNGYFVDLFVRASNNSAIAMYTKLGYTVYRRVLEYYSGEEDALDMRKALPRDVTKKSVIPLPHPVRALDETD
ncbi:N-alpha-acetyltransferase 20 [Pelomyxa schiedti]|nr:N-alpha-acetyltransferase 20 [Pelomyxa schiedti]